MSDTVKKLERVDPLKKPQPPDRVYYATGILLDAEDFSAEQTYHRAQLARALAHLHGSGTVAGLKVILEPATTGATSTEEQLKIDPGIAIDRLGRFIEVPRAACIRLERWFKNQEDDDLVQALYTGPEAPKVRTDVEGETKQAEGIVADLFVRFVICERGKTPAFAAGPFDALDAVEPSRLRDGYELKLFLRKRAADKSLPEPEKQQFTNRTELHKAIFEAWHNTTDREEMPGHVREHDLRPLAEHLVDQDRTYVFLARVVIPAELATGASRPTRRAANVEIDNHIRPFVYTAGELARLSGVFP